MSLSQVVPAPGHPDAAPPDLETRVITAVRMLAVDMVECAGSGHPGMPLGAAPMAWTLWSRHLRKAAADPSWPDRDRFVLSAGHGSALQYALLHLFGYDLPLDQLARFRRLGSLTPGHPERGVPAGVEVTTGPLGQGIGNAVGMALAERMLNARFGEVVDHRTYAIAGDGCLMEGISHEAASLAGNLRLGRLIVLYDDNRITIDGGTSLSCRDDALQRFAAYGWHTSKVSDGEDVAAIDAAIREAKEDPRPSLVAVRTVIGHGAPGVEGTSAAHGAPLGANTAAATRERFGWPDEAFHVPVDVRDWCSELSRRDAATHAEWNETFARWAERAPELAAEWERRLASQLPAGLDASLATVPVGRPVASRQASAAVLATIGEAVPELVGGSADLAGSTGTDRLPGGSVRADDYGGTIVHFGIREHGMAAALNGIAAHGGLRAFGSTFLAFSDYLRPSLRLAALMHLPVVYVFTHDSVAVGEDGPTHQPVEQLESLRLIPGLAVLRPADDAETVSAWRAALRRRDGPTALILSRQCLDPRGPCPLDVVERDGARIVGPDVPDPDVTLLASGSEVGTVVAAAQELTARGTPTRVLSVPWRERFAAIGADRRAELLGRPIAVCAVEAGVRSGWVQLTGGIERVVGLDRFGESGPGEQTVAHLGLTPAACVRQVRDALAAAGLAWSDDA